MAFATVISAPRETHSANVFRFTMNKFRSKLKGGDAAGSSTDALNILSSPAPSPVSPGLKKSVSRWKKTKKIPETRPELNIAAALPTSDDFRTSLLMPNLSKRFSMLREQDDPNSLLGKASDDSVLQPRRRSRMADFGFGSNGLNDILEVQSTRSSIKPGFHFGRQGSFGSQGYGSDCGDSSASAVMGRSRPGEGNNMFGGRQKVYKIAGGASSSGLGKAVYEDDIGMSAFQRYRKEREAVDDWQVEDEPSFDFGLDSADAHSGVQDDTQNQVMNDSAKDLSHSPSLSSYDKKRSTTSSTAHSEARSSTAATSVASQQAPGTTPSLVAASQPPAPTVATPPLKRSDTQKRRLYEQGLNEHMQEQQTSAMSRLNSLHRQRPLNNGVQSPPYLYTAKSDTNLAPVKPQQQQLYALRSQSPPPMAPLTTFGSLRKPGSNTGSPLTSGPQSPVSPQIMEFPELTQALEPGDRGKATAMGAFNKPKQSFDENQYLERQQQLQRSLSRKNSRKVSTPLAEQQRTARLEQVEREQNASSSSLQQGTGRSEVQERERSNSNHSTRSRSQSASGKHEPTKAYNVFQNAANSMAAKAGAPQYDTHRTFFGNISASDSEEEEDAMQQEPYHSQHSYGFGDHGRWQPAGLAPVSEHPAFRGHQSKPSLVEEEDEEMEPQPLRTSPSSRTLQLDATGANTPSFVSPELDSPTLGPSTSQPLNGLVHHLRQASNQSSVYPMDEAPEMPSTFWNTMHSGRDAVHSAIDTDSRVESTYTTSNSNPWDLDDADVSYGALENREEGVVSPVAESYRDESRLGMRAPSRAGGQQDRQSAVSQEAEGAPAQPWQHELRKQHNRDASTATQAERDAFANELAARRNAVQENLKSIVENQNQSRGASPAPSANGAFKAFGMLRQKSSRESVDTGRGPSAPTKAMKMLGIGGGNGTASSATLNSQYEHNGYSFEAQRPRKNSGPGGRAPPTPQPARMPPNVPGGEWDPQTRTRGDSNSRARSRSNSEATTGRSRSRTGPYRDDLEKAMIEGTGSSAACLPNLSPMITRELTPRASPDPSSSAFDGQARSRSNSRPGLNTYFDAKNTQLGSMPPTPRLATGLSPGSYTTAGNASRSPVSPLVQNIPTPPMSGNNTPHSANFLPHMSTIQPRQGGLRKRTVSKWDISEPTLISATSNVDTVELPEGASLKNGLEPAPPLPPINPKRRGARKIFGIGRSEMSDAAQNYGNYGRSKTPDPWMSRSTTEPDFDSVAAATRRSPRGGPGHSSFSRPGVMPSQQAGRFENHSSPAIPQYAGVYTPTGGDVAAGVYMPTGAAGQMSPERADKKGGGFEGGMF
ncbi:hypothetical protein LTR62_004000 [Meristemomyces frigidus]|uniref:Uncharacterized protein n=1 Tax=Meristemomyces frigidus TaxID=1508187 RepID=A0AAN7TIA4_9PEZI|nr:hypothetical protein LTR62_004000 [Meristemomyces frigidus]